MKGPLCLLFAILISTLVSAQKIKYTGSLCEGGSLILSVEDAPSGSTYRWTLNGNNTTTTTPTYTISTAGSYGVIITAGGTSTTLDPVDIAVKPKPVPSFSSSPNGQCSNQPVFFTNTTPGIGLSYSWDFGDPNSKENNTSTAAEPSHKFVGTPGNGSQSFTVRLTVTSSDGCTASTTRVVTTKQTPSLLLDGPSISTYDGKSFFKSCTGTNSLEFDFSNRSTTSNTSYKIVWGDGSPDYVSTTFPGIQLHTYNLGSTKMLFIVSGQNGCTDTAEYYAFVGSNPAVGLGNPGNTSICTGSSLTFPISNTGTNPPGTDYLVEFNDGSAPIKYTHPAPADVTHTFNKTSCGTTSGTYSNSFSASIKASNPCQSSSATVVPIYVSQKPTVSFTTPKDSVCVGSVVFTNTSGTSSYVNAGNCENGKAVWSVSPATGWSVNGGSSLGDDHGRTDPSRWTAGSNTLSLNFTTPGTYTIKLKTGNPLCGMAETTRTICVNPKPIASFTVNETQGCGPLTVKTTNTSPAPNCGNNSYSWSVSYSNTAGCTPNASLFNYINGTSSISENPEFQFINPGTYTINLTTRTPGGTCVSSAATQTIVVKDKPKATINMPTVICQNGSITPTAIVPNCNSGTPTYAWSFPGGTPSSANTANPGAITYSSAGGHTVTLTVTNECGSTTVSQNLNVSIAPDVIVPSNQTLCAGTATGGYNFSSSVSGTTYTWTNNNTAIGLAASGTGNIPSFTAVNNTNAPVVATITVTPRTGCAGPSSTFTITVGTSPARPTATSPLTYCLNGTAVPLTATAEGSNTLTWYTNSNLTGGTTTAPTPSTSLPGTTTYFVTQTNDNGCKSPAAQISVTVYSAITNNVIGNNQSLCTGASAATLTQASGSVSGGNNTFTYKWETSTDGGTTWTPIAGAVTASYNPGVLSAPAKFRRVVSSGPCLNHTSNEISINVQGSLNNVEISKPQTICAGTQPEMLTGQEPTGSSDPIHYVWESSTNNTTWNVINSATSKDYHPSALNATTYFRRKVSSGSCSVYSSSITITVIQKPVVTQISDKTLCSDAATSPISFTSVPASNVTFKWENDNAAIGLAASGTGSIPVFTALNTSNPKVPVFSNISVVSILDNGGSTCEGSPMNFKITVLPVINITKIDDFTVCSGSDVPSLQLKNDASTYNGSQVSYSWTVAGAGISLTNGTGSQIPSFTASNNTSSDMIATIMVTPRYHLNGNVCSGVPMSYSVTVKPGTPKASAGPDETLCAATEYTMKGALIAGSTGTWSFIGTTANIVDAISPTTQLKDLQPGTTYRLVWTVSGYATCPPTKDTVVIINYPSLNNAIDITPLTICEGQSITINGQQPTGGNGTFQFQWQESTGGGIWTDITGQTRQNLTYAPNRSVSIRRVVNSLPCTLISEQVAVNVQPGVTNNTIASDKSICVNNAILLKGSQPAGGDNQYSFKWEQSTNNGTSWTIIPGATEADYQTGLLTQTTKYRRKVTTSLCSGAQENSSNVVTITVNLWDPLESTCRHASLSIL